MQIRPGSDQTSSECADRVCVGVVGNATEISATAATVTTETSTNDTENYSRSSHNIESLSKDEVVKLLDLHPHPEGGYFKETWRSGVGVIGGDSSSSNNHRVCGTGILFLLGTEDKSHLHKLTAGNDEMWHHYAGKTLEIIEIDEATGKLTKTKLGKHLLEGEHIQYVVAASKLFGSRVLNACTSPGPDWTLVGCTVCPGFEFADFEMPSRDELLERFPHLETEIVAMTRSGCGEETPTVQTTGQ